MFDENECLKAFCCWCSLGYTESIHDSIVFPIYAYLYYCQFNFIGMQRGMNATWNGEYKCNIRNTHANAYGQFVKCITSNIYNMAFCIRTKWIQKNIEAIVTIVALNQLTELTAKRWLLLEHLYTTSLSVE